MSVNLTDHWVLDIPEYHPNTLALDKIAPLLPQQCLPDTGVHSWKVSSLDLLSAAVG